MTRADMPGAILAVVFAAWLIAWAAYQMDASVRRERRALRRHCTCGHKRAVHKHVGTLYERDVWECWGRTVVYSQAPDGVTQRNINVCTCKEWTPRP